jgi:uncharacterized protein with NRDE domain
MLTAFVKLLRLLVSLFWIWITLDWNVRKARKAFEKELIKQRIPEENARRLSKQLQLMKDQMMSSLWQLAFK